jgi:hypothetical protein
MTEKLVEDDPPIIRRKLGFLKGLDFGGVKEWREL